MRNGAAAWPFAGKSDRRTAAPTGPALSVINSSGMAVQRNHPGLADAVAEDLAQFLRDCIKMKVMDLSEMHAGGAGNAPILGQYLAKIILNKDT